jgi:uncharacterized protein YjeT (DUF2065 family)
MDIVLFSLGLILVIIGFPLCLSCQIQVFWKKMSRAKVIQPNQQSNQNVKRNRTIGLFSITVGVLIMIFSLSGVSVLDCMLASNRGELQLLLSL